MVVNGYKSPDLVALVNTLEIDASHQFNRIMEHVLFVQHHMNKEIRVYRYQDMKYFSSINVEGIFILSSYSSELCCIWEPLTILCGY